MDEKISPSAIPTSNGNGSIISKSQDEGSTLKRLMKKLLGTAQTPNGIPSRPTTKHENIYPQKPSQKSVFITYVLWLFGGFLGLHHLYLHRDRHAFLIWCSLGGFAGIGWFLDVFKIPEYVRDANEDPVFISKFVEKLRKYPRPPFSAIRFTAAVCTSYMFGQLVMLSIPPDEVMGINFRFLLWTVPFFAALGVWVVGNIGREKGNLKPCLTYAYLFYLLRYVIYDESFWFTGMVFAAAGAFDNNSKEWRREPLKRHTKLRRTLNLGSCVVMYLAIFSVYLYFNGKVTDSDGEEVPFFEAVKNFLKSSMWTDLKQTCIDLWTFAQHNGWGEIWRQIIESIDADGEQNAYKVLGLGPTATQSEITSVWRKMSREFHPDKVKDESLRREAQEKFMEIQQAYEVLSKIKSKRRSKNKKYKPDEDVQIEL